MSPPAPQPPALPSSVSNLTSPSRFASVQHDNGTQAREVTSIWPDNSNNSTLGISARGHGLAILFARKCLSPPLLYSLFYCLQFAIVAEKTPLPLRLWYSSFRSHISCSSTIFQHPSLRSFVHDFPYLLATSLQHDCWPVSSPIIATARRTHVFASLSNQKVCISRFIRAAAG